MPGRSRQDSISSLKSIRLEKQRGIKKKRKRGKHKTPSENLPTVHSQGTSIPVLGTSVAASNENAARSTSSANNAVQQAQDNLVRDPQARELTEVYKPPNSEQEFYMPPGSSNASQSPNPVLPPAPKKSILRKQDPLPDPNPSQKNWWKKCYDPEKKTICDRSFGGWIILIVYTIMYMLFLATFTALFLYMSLCIVKSEQTYMKNNSRKSEFRQYSAFDEGIGLTATPTALYSSPLIWYRLGVETSYKKYIKAIEDVVKVHRRSHEASVRELGPCGKSPFGYGDAPCVIVRINKELGWTAQPLKKGSREAQTTPPEVKQWLKLTKQKLWLHCEGLDLWVKEHISKINYFPDPPGFDPGAFPLNATDRSPLVAIQFAKFTKGLSLKIQCTLYYDQGVSSAQFTLYVTEDLTRKAMAKGPKST